MQSGRTRLVQELLQKRMLSTQEAKTTLVGEPPFSDLHAAKIVANCVQLTHGLSRIKFGTAFRGLGLHVDGFDPVLDTCNRFISTNLV